MANWLVGDGNFRMTEGLKGISSVKVIQKPDASGGYNVHYGITGSMAFYHIHFNRNGLRIRAIRYKSGSTDQGTNIVTCNGERFADLIWECKDRAGDTIYPNSKALMEILRQATANAPKDLRAEIA